MRDDLIYSITPEEDELSKASLEKDRERRDALEARLEELNLKESDNTAFDDQEADIAGSISDEKDEIYRELISLSRRHYWQNVHGSDYINNLCARGRTDEAEELIGKLLPGYYLWAHCTGDRQLGRGRMLQLAMNYDLALSNENRYRDAVPYLQLARREYQQMVREEGAATNVYGPVIYYSLSYALSRIGQLEAAESVLEEGLRNFEELRKNLSGEDYLMSSCHYLRNNMCIMLTALLAEAGKKEECGKLLQENLGVQRELHEAFPDETGGEFVRALYLTGTWYMFCNRFEEAFPVLQEAAGEVMPDFIRIDQGAGIIRVDECIEMYLDLAELLARAGKEKEAGECRRIAEAYETELPEEKRRLEVFFNRGKMLRGILYQFIAEASRTPDGEYLRPAVRIQPEEWERIRRSMAKDADFSNLLAFADESVRQDKSEGVLVLEQGICFRSGNNKPAYYSWNDIEDFKMGEDGSLGIRERGVDDDAFEWFRLKNPELINRLIREAKNCLERKNRVSRREMAAPVPDPGIMDSDAVFERFRARKKEKQREEEKE
ncbi:MAG: hypothetical protein K5637_00395 [Lachnospiraceae bacterium]|nr:hypothetical protein [Lachnospiraceae bacterium]